METLGPILYSLDKIKLNDSDKLEIIKKFYDSISYKYPLDIVKAVITKVKYEDLVEQKVIPVKEEKEVKKEVKKEEEVTDLSLFF